MKRLRDLVKIVLGTLLKRLGVVLLTRQQTEAYLEPYILAASPETQIVLPGVPNTADPSTLVFVPTEAVTHKSYVWAYKPDSKKTSQLRFGGILTDARLLCTDFEQYHLLINFLTAKKRPQLECGLLIAPWSHHSDGAPFGGYYDFVILVAAKVCRIKEALPEAVWAETVLAYPLFKTTYEQEYLELLGFTPNHVLDSRLYEIQADQYILANSGHWFYPNLTDILALKKQVEGKLKPKRTEYNRIYISRAGRRKVVNEAALIELLLQYNFTIIDDRPRSVAEQVTIYKNASFIIGPHGGSFTNIIWCEPGAHLFELFPSTMVVDHFRYLAQLMGMHYSAYYHVIMMGNSRVSLEEDIFVSIADLEQSLNKLLEPA